MKINPFQFFIYLGFVLLFVHCESTPADVNITNNDDLTAYLTGEMEDQNIPALSVLAFAKDEVVYEQYLGKSDLGAGVDLQADHLFLLASVSKMVTGTALLQLYEDGRFALDDPINDYLSFAVNVPNANTPITFRMLLTHTSGIADGSALDDQYYYGKDSPVALADFLKNYLTPGGRFYAADENFHDFDPGSRHEYSNIGSALIGLFVEEIADMDFNEYCKQNIFNPLGMTNTAWRLDEINQTIVQPYDYINGENEAIGHYTFTDYPNGGLRSTARDMFKFLTALTESSSTEQILETATIQAMFNPQIPSLDNQVGLHTFLMDSDHNLWGHDGGEQGVATIMAVNPNNQVGVILLSNQGEADLEELLIEVYEHIE